MRAIRRDAVLAESADAVVVEGNHHFPADALRREHFRPSATHTTCPRKGEASYYDIGGGGDDANRDAAWHYPQAKDAAHHVEGRVAFEETVTSSCSSIPRPAYFHLSA